MSQARPALIAFNRGIISPLALARVDLERLRMSAETQTNFMPRVLGSMMLRPGTVDIGATLNNSVAKHVSFVRSFTEKAIIEFTDLAFRVRVNGAIITRPSVTTAITNGGFDADVTGWTDDDEAATVSQWAAGGYLQLTGDGLSYARRYQTVTVTSTNIRHSLRVIVNRGPVGFKVGSTVGGGEYLDESLKTGTHSLSFTPAGNFTVTFESNLAYSVYVDSVQVEAAGDMVIPTTWAAADLPLLRHDQSIDVLFCTVSGQMPRRIERRAADSWSFVEYAPENGPWRITNTTTTTLASSAVSGDVTLTASRPLFKAGHVGALFQIESIGQFVTIDVTAENQWSNHIRVVGVGADRDFRITVTGSWSGTVTVQRSIGVPGSWTKYRAYTSNHDATSNDDLDNAVIYYRIGMDTGDYTSGTAECQLDYAGGSIPGICKIVGVTNATTASAIVLKQLGQTTASERWKEGAWSTYRGFPSAVALHEGRIAFAGKDKIWLSESDAFESFDDAVEGDSGPFSRSIGSGPVETINWLMPLQRLLVGGLGAERSARSSSLDEPLTPANFNLKTSSTQGSAPISPAQIDSGGVFVQFGGTRVFLAAFNPDRYDYASEDITLMVPDLNLVGIKQIAVQRQPDTRIHCLRNDGTVAILVLDKREDVQCWVIYETAGLVTDIMVQPDDGNEDAVYYTVLRGANRRLEKWAKESECLGGIVSKLADGHVVYQGPATNTITGLGHLEGLSVVVWQDGIDGGTYTVSGGSITLLTAATNAVVGLGYTGKFKSAKLAYAGAGGTALCQRKRIAQVGVILKDTHYQGLEFGPDFASMDPLPLSLGGKAIPANTIHSSFDGDMIEFPGDWSTDSRLCLQAQAPRPCTVLAAVIAMETQDGETGASEQQGEG